MSSQDNNILSLKDLGHQPELVNLHAQRNSIIDFAEVRVSFNYPALSSLFLTSVWHPQVYRCPKLHEVCLEGNPIAQMDLYA
jgi:hypothetical protein